MVFRTIVNLPAESLHVTPEMRGLVLGSCFAEHIGGRLATALDGLAVNPWGTLYNPLSIAAALDLALSTTTYAATVEKSIFLGRDGLWHTWLGATRLSGTTRDECLSRTLEATHAAHTALCSADASDTLLIVTFGTNVCYHLLPDGEEVTQTADEAIIRAKATDTIDTYNIIKESRHITSNMTIGSPTADGSAGMVVANCHKELATRFCPTPATTADILAVWRPLLARLAAERPGMHILFTVSPYRYRSYGLHASQLAKAHLLLAIEALVAEGRAAGLDTHYFPAYEIVLDELRDYRFYAADMLHPSEQAIDYIWERFRTWTFDSRMTHCYTQRLTQLKRANHHENCH